MVASDVGIENFKNAGAGSRVVFRVPLFPRLFSLFGTTALAIASVIMTGFAVLVVLGRDWIYGVLLLAPCAVFLACLTGYGARDLRGKWGIRVALDADSMTLDLPAGRSLIHRPATQHLNIPYANIAAVETRLEAYVSLGMAMLQRAFVLRLKTGELIFLFEDRAIATQYEIPLFQSIATQIAQRAGVALNDIGMVQGKGGVLGVWGAHEPDWAAPALPLAQQMRLWRHAATTGTLSIVVVVIAIVIRLLSGPL